MTEHDLARAEYGISACQEYPTCNATTKCEITLSSIQPGDERRGSRDAKVILVTEAPDQASSEGTAYKGGISGRIRSMFTEQKYGVGLSDSSGGFSEFLDSHQIYATSAIKCHVNGSISELGNSVIRNCRSKYLEKQIEAMDDLELIVPMGKLAAASILKRNYSSFNLTSLVGRQRGMVDDPQDWDAPIVVLPHPSGASTLSNPPVFSENDSRQVAKQKDGFRRALVEIRKRLDSVGYDVLDDNPDSWEASGGLSSFT
ncbi:uracil-DNA glycosylase family protein [Halobaculum sp. P14]|uniref:uracil-DNA glycosylase family protein n=1 Tax=Halobaculum sp. P14 TaxID=3421638 RepID=UPI003EBE4DAE